MQPSMSTDRSPGLSFCRRIYGIAIMIGSNARMPSIMPGTIPIRLKQKMARVLHSRVWPVEKSQRVHADAMAAEIIAAAMKSQYSLSKFTVLVLRRNYIWLLDVAKIRILLIFYFLQLFFLEYR